MSKVFSAHAVSIDGYITGRGPGPGRGLGDGSMLFDWYLEGTTPSQVFDGFRLSEPSARIFDALAGRVGAVVAGRNTYEDSDHFGGGSPHPTARLFVLSHRPAPEISDRQTLVTTGIADAIAAAREAAGDKDVGLMGGGVATAALQAGLVDELILHQVPVLLGGGRPFFQALPEHVRIRLVEAVPSPGVTHLHYEVARDPHHRRPGLHRVAHRKGRNIDSTRDENRRAIMNATVTDDQIRQLAETAKPYSLALRRGPEQEIMDGDPCVRARMILCDVHSCHGFPGDALPA